MKNVMTKQKISVVLAVALLAAVSAVATRDVWAQTAANNLASSSDTGYYEYDYSTDAYVYQRQNADGDYITTDLTIGFPLEQAVTDGSVRVLIPTATSSATANVPQEKVFTAVGGTLNGVSATCPTAAGAGLSWENAKISQVLYNTKTGVYTESATLDNSIPSGDAADYIRYIAVTCSYTGTPTRGGQYAMGDLSERENTDDYHITMSGLINPKRDTNSTEPSDTSYKSQTVANAVTIPGRIQLFDAKEPSAQTTNMISDIDVLISTIVQDVLVRAQVEYQLMFRVDGVAANEEVKCQTVNQVSNAYYPTVSTTPLKIDFGAPSVGVPVDAAQRIYVNSSVGGGYKITVSQNRNMRRQDVIADLTANSNYDTLCYSDDGMITPGTTINRDCIPNFDWEEQLTADTSKAWAATATSSDKTGLGYTTAVNRHTGTVVTTDDASGVNFAKNIPSVNAMFETAGSSGAGSYDKTGGKAFSRLVTRKSDGSLYANAGYTTNTDKEPTVIASSAGIAEGDYYDVCYRLVVDGNNNAGVYDNEITYTITASI